MCSECNFIQKKVEKWDVTVEKLFVISEGKGASSMSEFKIYPAIDMRGGKCVRLIQGDYNQETVYGDSPFDMAKSFATRG